jgi:hypothetical protein
MGGADGVVDVEVGDLVRGGARQTSELRNRAAAASS